MLKKAKKTIPQALRHQIWDIYIGIGEKYALCPLCGINTIYSAQKNSGFEGIYSVLFILLNKIR